MRLDHFAELTGFDICAMYGFHNGPEAVSLGCNRVWSNSDRQIMTMYLNNARDRVENELGFPVYPRFVCGERARFNTRGLIGSLRWGYLQKVGTRTVLDIETVPTVLTDDDWEFTVTVDFTDTCEARIFHTNANGGAEIFPLSKSISGTTLTIKIKKCVLVDPAITVPTNGLDYTDNSNFVSSVEIRRVYAQEGIGSSFIWSPNVSTCDTCSPCVETTQLACPTVRNTRLSELHVRPATYAAGVWTGAQFTNCNRYPDIVELDYVAYYDEDCDAACEQIPSSIKQAIMHVALADLPTAARPCGCGIHKALFEEDPEIPKFIPQDNPFGIKIGHIIAHAMLRTYKIGSGGLLVAP